MAGGTPPLLGTARTHQEERPTNELPPTTIDLGHLLNRAEHLGIQALQRVLDRAQGDLWEELRRHEREDGSPRFVSWGFRPRTLYTKMGVVHLWVRRVRDRLTRKLFSPLLQALGIGKKRYTQELRLAAAEMATRTSYEEASQAIERTLGFRIPRRTIWNFLQELAKVVEVTLHHAPPPTPERVATQTHSVDSTFVRGKRRKQQLEVHAAITQGQDHRVQLVDVRIGGHPAAVLEGEPVERLMTDDESGLRAFGAREQGLCQVHFCRHLADLLGQEGLGLAEREEIVRPVKGLLAHLRNSAEAHRQDGHGAALTHRVQVTLEELGALGHRLREGGCPRSSRFVLREMRALVVFAQVGAGLWMPATTNGMERVMGMVADRCKRKWAHWSNGLHNMVLVLLSRKIRPRVYGLAVRRYMSPGGGW